jgi:hypothetical protein
MDNRPNKNGLVNNHIPKFGFFKTDLDPVMSFDLLTGYFAHPVFTQSLRPKTQRKCTSRSKKTQENFQHQKSSNRTRTPIDGKTQENFSATSIKQDSITNPIVESNALNF